MVLGIKAHEPLLPLGCPGLPSSAVYRLHAEPKSGSSWFSRVFVSLLQRACLHMRSAGCVVLHHEEDTRQEPEIVLRFGTFYRSYLTLTPNYKHAGECMFVKNTHSAKLLQWMVDCLKPQGKNRTVTPVTSDACIPRHLRRCAERLGATHGLTERKILLMRDPRAVALAIAHSVAAERQQVAAAASKSARWHHGATGTSGNESFATRLTPPDVRASDGSGTQEDAARRARIGAWVEQSFDAIVAEMAFRYEWFGRVLAQHTPVLVLFYEELQSDTQPWLHLLQFVGVCANESHVREALADNSLRTLKAIGYTVARKGEAESFRRELEPRLVERLNLRMEALMQPTLLRRWGILREIRVADRLQHSERGAAPLGPVSAATRLFARMAASRAFLPASEAASGGDSRRAGKRRRAASGGVTAEPAEPLPSASHGAWESSPQERELVGTRPSPVASPLPAPPPPGDYDPLLGPPPT